MDLRLLLLRTPRSSSTRVSNWWSCWSNAARSSSTMAGDRWEVPYEGSRYQGVEPGCCRVPLPQLMGASGQGLLIREHRGQRRLSLCLPAQVLRVHARRHAHSCDPGHAIAEGVEHVEDRLHL